MVMSMSRHQFLTALHAILKPQIYMETGVQGGVSLNLAHEALVAIGIDPQPMVRASGNQQIHAMTSQDYFATAPDHKIDLGFIDGSHLIEDVLLDFLGMAKLAHSKTVIVFDDVLPYNDEIANRVMPPGGDWTGDAWKIIPILQSRLRDSAKMVMVDTFPTGLFVVWDMQVAPQSMGWRLTKLSMMYEDLVNVWAKDHAVPDFIRNRTEAAQAEQVLAVIREELCASQ